MRRSSAAQIIALVVLGLFWTYFAFDLTTNGRQWDFQTYYYAADAQHRHLDPYNIDITSQLSGAKLSLPYVYPPLTLWFFRAFNLLDYTAASQMYLFLQFVLLAGLIVIWMKYFLENENLTLFLWFVTLAFSSTVYWDLAVGNIALIEQAFLWTALLALLRRKLLIFTIAIVLISFFKLSLIVFVGLPLLWRERGALKYVLAGLGTLAIYIYANHALAAGQSYRFWSIVIGLDERGELYNHALLPFVRDIFDRAALGRMIPALPRLVPDLIYLVVVALILIVSWRVYRRRSKVEIDAHAILETVFFGCLVYALVMPRMKSYSFILLIPPAYYALRKYLKAETFVYAFILLALTKWTPLPVPDVVRFLWWYYPWLCALLIWVLYLRYWRKPTTGVA